MTRRRSSGQTSVEYMLVISVIVVAVVATAYVFVPEFQEGVAELSSDVSTGLATGSINGVGFDRANNGGGPAGGLNRPGNAGHGQKPRPPKTNGG